MKRLILVGRWELIEPLGLLHLLGLARTMEWECEVVLIQDSNFAPLFELVQSFRPDLIGLSVWTGWHLESFAAADWLRSKGYRVVIGGPHATYFTDECARHADWAVKGDGFRSFRLVLEAVAGISSSGDGSILNGIASTANQVVLHGANSLFDT